MAHFHPLFHMVNKVPHQKRDCTYLKFCSATDIFCGVYIYDGILSQISQIIFVKIWHFISKVKQLYRRLFKDKKAILGHQLCARHFIHILFNLHVSSAGLMLPQ